MSLNVLSEGVLSDLSDDMIEVKIRISLSLSAGVSVGAFRC